MNEQTYPWYMVNKDGMCTLCADQADAEQEAKNAQEAWPHMGPHRAVRLVEVGDAGFTAADMATASAQGFRDGQAAELAAMRAGGKPVAWAATSEDGDVEALGMNQSRRFDTPLYTHPQPAAQDAERKPLSKEQRAEIMEEVDSYNFPEDLIDATEKAHGIKGGQHEI